MTMAVANFVLKLTALKAAALFAGGAAQCARPACSRSGRSLVLSAMRDFERGNQGTSLVYGLLVLPFGHRIGDQAGARLHRSDTLVDHHGADGDAGIEIPGKIQVQDGKIGRASCRERV